MIGNIGYERRLQALERRAREISYGVPGIWSAWTPVLGQNGVVTSTPDGACRYCRIGNLVIASFRIVATASGDPNQIVNMAGLPAQFLHSGARAVGSFTFYKSATNTFYDGSILPFGTTDLIFSTDGSTNYFGASPALTVQNNDVMTGTFQYEAA